MNANSESLHAVKLNLSPELIAKIEAIAEAKGMTFNDACLFLLTR